jgi:hypothetical protein
LVLEGRLKGSSADDWSVQVVTPGSGTFALQQGENGRAVLSSSPHDHAWGYQFDGHGEGKRLVGTLAVHLWDAEGHHIGLRGGWDSHGVDWAGAA